VAASDDHSKPRKGGAKTLDVADVIRRIVANERHLIPTLTSRQKDEVINALAYKQIEMKRKHDKNMEEAEEHIENVQRNHALQEHARFVALHNPLRDHFLLRDAPSNKEKAEKAEKAAQAEKAASSDTPAKEHDTPTQVSEFGDSQMITSTPLPSSAKHNQQKVSSSTNRTSTDSARDSSSSPRNNVAQTPKPNLLRRAFGLLSSPFGTIRKLGSSQLHRPSLLQNGTSHEDAQEPLGSLPASRKRSAPEPEPEVQHEPKFARVDFSVVDTTPTRNNNTLRTPRTVRGGPSTLDHTYPTPLGAISEYTEPSEATMRQPEPTPSRPATTKPTPNRNRDIASVRRQRELASRVEIPRRAWDPKPVPRIANADTRLLKLQHYHEIKDRLRELQKDEDIKDMVHHRTKRVKVDDLVVIPHNRPGEPSGTFRMYDADSDDEMEVDESAELRENVFEEGGDSADKQDEVGDEQGTAQTQQATETQQAQQVPQQPQAAAEEEKEAPEGVELMHFNDLPDLGTRDPNDPEEDPDPLGEIKFQIGYQHFLRTGENLGWLWEQDGFGDHGGMAA
jgi:hypothetical protein